MGLEWVSRGKVNIRVNDDSGHYVKKANIIISKEYLEQTFSNILGEDQGGVVSIQLVSDKK